MSDDLALFNKSIDFLKDDSDLISFFSILITVALGAVTLSAGALTFVVARLAKEDAIHAGRQPKIGLIGMEKLTKIRCKS